MPFISMKTNASVPAKTGTSIRSGLGEAIRLLPGKTESWLMLSLEDQLPMAFAGTEDPCAMVQVQVYGHQEPSSYNRLTEAVTALLSKELGIDPSRIYVAYQETMNWGWNGSNF